MGSLLRRIKSLDTFREPVGLNYKGDSAFRMLPGAFFTLFIAVFLLFFGMESFLDLVGYKNPQITQVSKVNPR